MCLNPVSEEFDRAYANVGLLASNVWSYKKEEIYYKRANLHLWIRFNETEQRLVDEDSEDGQSTSTEEITHTVQDTIPFSRLATYNDFAYNEERERLYCNDDESTNYIENPSNAGQNDLEVWMLPEVEEEFKRLTHPYCSRWGSISPRIPTGREIATAEQVTTVSPYQWLTKTSWPNQLLARYPDLPRALHESHKRSFFNEELLLSSYDPAALEEKLEEFPCPRYLIETNADLELHTRIDCPQIRGLWATQEFHYGGLSPCFDLNAEIPEFQPVTLRQQQYPSIYNGTYEAELFPYSSSPLPYDIQHEIIPIDFVQVYAKEEPISQNNTVFVNPPETYFNVEDAKTTWKKHQEEALLNSPPCSEQRAGLEVQHESSKLLATLPLQSLCDVSSGKSLNTQKMLAFLDNWLDKIYKTRSNDFTAISTIPCRIDKIFQNVQQNYSLIEEALPMREQNARRPLYSDVLMNEASPSATPCSDRKFEELEREAVEQYSGSDMTMPDKVKYQEAKDQHHSTREARGVRSRDTETIRLIENNQPLICNESYYPQPGSTRSSADESCHNKQAIWMKKKKKRSEKKKHLKQDTTTASWHQNKFIESEIISINKLLQVNNLFLNTFFKSDWKIVQKFVTEDVLSLFVKILKAVQECSDWFRALIITEKLKEDLRINKKRLVLADNVADVLHDLLALLNWYIHKFSTLKIKIHCDQRLYFEPNRLIVQTPLREHRQEPLTSSSQRSLYGSFQTVDLVNTPSTGRSIPMLYNCSIRHQNFNIQRCEWKLTSHDNPVTRHYSSIHMDSKEGSIYLSFDSKGEPNKNIPSKLLKTVENPSVWTSWQWKFVDGWMFSRSNSPCSLNWLNKFNANSLESIASSAHLFIFYDWVFDFINTAFFKKNKPMFELLWDIKRKNLVSGKMMFLNLLLKREEGWCFGEVRVTKTGSENSCCITWLLTPDPVKATVHQSKQHTRTGTLSHRGSSVLENKVVRSHATSKSKTEDTARLSSDKQPQLDQQSSCTVQ